MTTSEIKKVVEAAKMSIEEAGRELVQHYGKVESELKNSTGDTSVDIVTKLDRQTEEFLEKKFNEQNPEIGFRGEEFGVSSEGKMTWLVDPIDGTAHFVRGIPFCTTMAALIEDETVVASIIHHFVTGDTYWAICGGGAYKNDEKISVSSRPVVESMVSFETRLHKSENYKLYEKLRNRVGNTMSTVNSGYEFSLVAEGKIDARIVKDGYGMDWDYAPGTLMVEEAGGVVKNLGSNTYNYKNHDFIAANPQVYESLTAGDSPIF